MRPLEHSARYWDSRCLQYRTGHFYTNNGGKIQNNIIYRASDWGITTWHAAGNLTISNNTVFANRDGISIGDGDNPGGINCDHMVVSNNIVYAQLRYGIREQGLTGPNNRYLNNLSFANPAGSYSLQNGLTATGSVNADPQFVNYQADGSGD